MVARHSTIPELVPQPKKLSLTGGDSNLSIDVRLSTSNVSPSQRKAIRSILTDVGVRVVANKKTYVIEAKVEEESAFDLSDVPVAGRREYYELKIHGSKVTVRAPEQEGTVWAAQTLATLFKVVVAGGTLPNLTIRDWPNLPVRGVFVENKWGPDRMMLIDWCQTIDRLSAVKMNTIGIGLYGCWGHCRYEGPDKPTEFLMVPAPGRDDLKTPHTLRWFSPKDDQWYEETYLAPFINQEDLLRNVVEYGRERGVTVIPFVNSFGHNTYFARVMPELSAKDANGDATGVGYCITSPETREFVENFYEGIISRYFCGKNGDETSIDYFHIQMDEVWPDYPWPDEPTKVGDPWCKCERCAKKKPEENLLDYVFWLVDMLTKKGVKKVVMWNDQLTRHMSAFDANFVKRLEKAGLKDKLILHWWWYSNTALNDKTKVSIGKKLGIEGWVAPMTCYYNWNTYDFRRPNIDMMMRMADAEGASGAVSYAVHDPSHLDHEALLAVYAWESTADQDMEEVHRRWATATFGKESVESYVNAADKLLKAVRTPAYGYCPNYSYTYYFKDGAWPRQYPGEALDALATKLEGVDVPAQLREAAALAQEAEDLFRDILATATLSNHAEACLQSLCGDALRVQAYAEAFAWLFELRDDLAPGMVKKSMATACQKARDDLAAKIAAFEPCKPTWVTPASLQALSTLLAFFDQLTEELKTFAARKRAKDINWTLLPRQEDEADDAEKCS